jgi:hypothetical protein
MGLSFFKMSKDKSSGLSYISTFFELPTSYVYTCCSTVGLVVFKFFYLEYSIVKSAITSEISLPGSQRAARFHCHRRLRSGEEFYKNLSTYIIILNKVLVLAQAAKRHCKRKLQNAIANDETH